MPPEINLNNAKCIVEKSHIGYSEFINICSGKKIIVDWTGLDWLSAFFDAGACLLLVGAVIAVLFMLAAMWKEMLA